MTDLTKLDELLAKAVDDINKCRQELKSHLAPDTKAIEEGVAKFGGKRIAKTSVHIIKDGDEKDDPIYAGCYYINVKSKDRPQIVDRNLQDIIDPEEIFSGMYARFSLSFYPYSFNNMRGISVAMGNVQKVKDGERFSGKTKASADFNDGFASNVDDSELPFGN